MTGTAEEDGPAMMRSMTGFASVTHDDERGSVSVTLRSVNHRFLDLHNNQLAEPQVSKNPFAVRRGVAPLFHRLQGK